VTADDLIAFEKRVADAFAAKQVKGPVHLSGGNEQQLIDIFRDISREDYVFSSYRSHYHALLHGIDPEWLFQQIIDGHSMNIMSPEHRFFTSAIVGGTLPIAVGVAAALKRKGLNRKVWCFIGDMAAASGAANEAMQYNCGHGLPLTIIVEYNGLSCDTPTGEAWGTGTKGNAVFYSYERAWPHSGIDRWIAF